MISEIKGLEGLRIVESIKKDNQVPGGVDPNLVVAIMGSHTGDLVTAWRPGKRKRKELTSGFRGKNNLNF